MDEIYKSNLLVQPDFIEKYGTFNSLQFWPWFKQLTKDHVELNQGRVIYEIWSL